MRVVTTLFLMAVSLSCLACVVSPTPAAPTPDIPATVEAIVREALATPEPTGTPIPSPTPKPRATAVPAPTPQIVIPTLASTELLRETGLIRYLVTATPRRPLPTVAPTEPLQATPLVTRRTATPVPPTATPTVLPTVAPTLVPVETASKVARTVKTSMGQRVDLTVEGFTDNRLRFDQLVQIINEEEQLLGVPFAAPRVSMRKVSQLPSGFCGHNQMSYESRYRGDPYIVEASVIRLRVDSVCDDAFGSIAHEVAHTWFHGNDVADWIDEGLANSIEYQVKEAHPEAAEKYPPVTYCASYRNISELEFAVPIRDASTEASGFSCNYRLGDGIFGALRQHFGADEFNRRIKKLARRSENRTNRSYTVTDVREALGADGKSRGIIDLWYDGEPEMRIYRHLDQVTFTHPPTLDGDYLHFAGRTQAPGMVHDLTLGKHPYCSQFFLYQGLADPEPLAALEEPLLVTWRHADFPEITILNYQITPETGEFRITARVNDRSLLMDNDLSLKIASRVQTATAGKCKENINFSQVKVVPGTIPDELKTFKHYHEDAIQWEQVPKVEHFRIRLAGTAPPGSLSFEWRDDFCSQVLFYELDVEGYRYIDSVNPMLPEGRHWQEGPPAEIVEGYVDAQGSFEAVIEIWDHTLLSHDHVVLVVRSETEIDKVANQCPNEAILGAVTIS